MSLPTSVVSSEEQMEAKGGSSSEALERVRVRMAGPAPPQFASEDLRLKRCFTVHLQGSCVQSKRQEVLDYFHNTYDLYEVYAARRHRLCYG